MGKSKCKTNRKREDEKLVKLHHHQAVIKNNIFKKHDTHRNENQKFIAKKSTLTDCIIILLLFLSYTDWSLIAVSMK